MMLHNASKRRITKAFPDWDAVRKRSARTGPSWRITAHPVLITMLASSQWGVETLYYIARHPSALKRLLALNKNPRELVAEFLRVEKRAITAAGIVL